METQKLYYQDSHLSRFTARVLSCEQAPKGFRVLLNATAFYPEGGGQDADTGILGGVKVLDTREQGDTIVHLCDGALEVGSTVEGVIDYAKRFTRMQQHSGEHIVSGIIHKRYGYSNTGFHMNLERMVIDFDGVIPAEALPEIEQEANTAVWQNLPVKVWYPSPEELPTVPYRTKKALPWPVRIVEIPGYDICACCGTHVSATGEIGLIKLFSAVPFRGGTRIEMACGGAALTFLNQIYAQNLQVSHAFSVPVTQTGDGAQQANDLLAAQKYRITGLERKIFASIAEGYRSCGRVLHFEEGLDSTAVRELADRIAETCGGTACVFSGSDGEGYSFCLVTRSGDLRPLGKAMAAALHGRGGGKPVFQQGRVSADRAAIEAFFTEDADGICS